MLRRKRQMVRNQNVSDEELQKTQVLNLADFKETARIERVCSKKPALVVAIIGVVAISIGTLFPAVQSLNARRNAQRELNSIQPRKASRESLGEQPVIEDLKCTFKDLNKANGTDEVIDVTYTFEGGKIVSLQKVYTLTQSASVKDHPAELDIYMNALQSYLIETDGYSVSVQTIPRGSITTTTAYYDHLEVDKIPEKYQENYRFDVIYQENTSKEQVKRDMATRKYSCVEE